MIVLWAHEAAFHDGADDSWYPFSSKIPSLLCSERRGGRTWFVIVTALYSYLPCICICYAVRGKEANTWFVFVTALYLYLHSICDVQREGKGWVLAGGGGEDLRGHPLQTTRKVPQRLSMKKKAVWPSFFRPWVYGHFSPTVLPAVCHLLHTSPYLRPSERANPVKVK